MYKTILFLFFCAFQTAHAQRRHMTPAQIAERSKPATVLIAARFSATATVVAPVANRVGLSQPKSQLASESLYPGDGLYEHELLMRYSKYIDRFIMRGTQLIHQTVETGGMGSGFIISPSGYMVDNAHMVDMNEEAVRQQLAESAQQIPGQNGYVSSVLAALEAINPTTYSTIRLGNDKQLRVGGQVYVLGYPGVATTQHPAISLTSIAEATLTAGLISAKKGHARRMGGATDGCRHHPR